MFEWAADLMTRYAHVGDLVKDSGSIDSSDTLKRMYFTRGLGRKYGPPPGCPGCATIGSHPPSQSLGHMQGQDALRTGEE